MSSPEQKVRLVAVAPHPIQYHAPLFRALAARPELDFEVAFLELLDDERQGQGFGVAFQWDIPVREGYRSRVLRTVRYARGHWGHALSRPQACLRELVPDALLLTGWHTLPLVQLLRAARTRGIPVLMRGDSHALKPRQRVVHQLHRWLFRQVDAFLVVGRANRALYERHGIPPERLFDAPHFVDNELFAGAAWRWRAKRDEVRAGFGIPSGATCFLYAGKFDANKRPEDLIAALGRVHRRRPDLRVHGLLVGAGERSSALQLRVREEGAPVTFTGFLNQTEIPTAYVAADVIVLTSAGETWGLVVNEAMACGLPALVSDRVGCGPDLVETDVTGARYPFGDVEAMASLIEEWTEHPERIRGMGRAAEERVRTQYTVGRSVNAVLDALRFTTGGRGREARAAS
jgi:glycosyltransferase involved in cell wall biosynthesis